MTFKYLWLFNICPVDEDMLHVPLDSYILNAIQSKPDENNYGLGISFNKKIKWSTMTCKNDYNGIQEIIKEKVKERKDELGFESAIAWENIAWIEQAKVEMDQYY